MAINGVVVGTFEEEEEGTGIASNGARGKRRGFRPGAATRYSQSARVHSFVRSHTFSDLFLSLYIFFLKTGHEFLKPNMKPTFD